MQKNISINDLHSFKYRMNWEITKICNFKCSYCPLDSLNVNEPPPKTPKQIANAFNRTGLTWLILITGGEPFLYPNFVDVCSELTKNHSIQITTNLSSNNMFDFVKRISPAKVFNICASYHLGQRYNRQQEQDFINKCNLLKDNGFNVIVNLIYLPYNKEEIINEFNVLKQSGQSVFLYAYRGVYNGLEYPKSYDDADIDMLRKYSIEDAEVNFALGRNSFYGKYCSAGINYFAMDRYGKYSRCFTLNKVLGDFFDGEFIKEDKIKPCIAKECNDYYQATVKSKAFFYSIYAEKHRYKQK